MAVQSEMKCNYLYCLVINQNVLVIFTDDPKPKKVCDIFALGSPRKLIYIIVF